VQAREQHPPVLAVETSPYPILLPQQSQVSRRLVHRVAHVLVTVLLPLRLERIVLALRPKGMAAQVQSAVVTTLERWPPQALAQRVEVLVPLVRVAALHA
jgi:hypothetical protein